MTGSPRLDRRSLLGCAALYGVAGPILMACSSDRADEGAGGADGNGSGEESGSTAEAGAALVAVADVPIGGGVALSDQGVVVTQPEEGRFKAYTNVCTHQGGAITRVEDGDMICSLHQSHFAIEDGSVTQDPATSPLPEVQVAVEGGQVVRA
jgi:nitrite reductase/ring-hydroxylating ferredoxin subunit